jgi:hypothetical protein
MNGRDSTLPPVLARCVRSPIDSGDDDELPPVIGERYRDTFTHIQRAAWEAAQEALHHD